MAPGKYTELFFLDEATSLSAGHRPCWGCRRYAYLEFKAACLRGNPEAGLGKFSKIDVLDAQVHGERVTRTGEKVTFAADIRELPEGVFVAMEDKAYLYWRGRLLRYTPEGYSGFIQLPAGAVSVLTPRSVVRAIAAGYVPKVLETAAVESDN